ncbi:hypothetical protein AB0J80_26690 [Actinoplanes sp. NPDC049548]|uniref:hypothetical protein n=1 Tax=Actinoplanes sp. NPDC049548 TaxID=3155152 RepID=UPI00343AD80C
MRLRRRDDDGSMPLAMLVLVVAVGLSVLLMATVMRETVSSRTSSSRATALLAARTGLNSALASLRAAKSSTDEYGDPSKLPCGLVEGTVGTTGGTYKVKIWYLTTNPASHDESWVIAHGGVPCATDLPTSAKFAYVLAKGSSAGGHSRTLSGTYEFVLREKGYTPGGQIRIYRTSSATQDWCLTAAPVVNTKLHLEACALAADGSIRADQLWAYTELLTIRQVNSPDAAALCAEAGSPQAFGQYVTLKPCVSSRTARQQWSFDENSNFRGTDDGQTLNGYCWNVTMPGYYIQLNDMSGSLSGSSKKCGQTLTDYQSWNVTTTAGSGAAGKKSKSRTSRQLVNYFQFGKCFDYTGYKNNGSSSGYLVWAFPCKQSPDPDKLIMSSVWNQLWDLPEEGEGPIYTTDPKGVTLCLRVPGAHAVRKDVVTAENCNAANVAAKPTLYPELIWRVRGPHAATWNERYRLEGTGAWRDRCLAPLAGVAGNAVQADYIGLVSCGGHDLQKWNAVPDVKGMGLMSVTEQ